MKKYLLLLLLMLLCIPICYAITTQNNSVYTVTALSASGSYGTDGSFSVSSVEGERGIGNYTTPPNFVEIGILYLLKIFSAPYTPPSTGGTGGGGTSLPTIPTTCGITISTQNLYFNSDKTEDYITIKTDSIKRNISIIIPEVPTVFGKKQLLFTEDNSFTLDYNKNKTIKLELLPSNIIDDINTSIIISSNYCNTTINVTVYKILPVFYDIRIAPEYMLYKKGEILTTFSTVENKGDIPDRDALIDIYLIDPDNRKTYYIRETMFEAKVGETRLLHRFALDKEAKNGKYTVGIEYTTENQGMIKAENTFYVTSVDRSIIYFSIFYLVIIIIIVTVFLIVKKRNS